MEVDELAIKAVELGRIAYEAYGERLEFMDDQGRPTQQLACLVIPEQIRSAFVRAAIAVAKKVAEY